MGDPLNWPQGGFKLSMERGRGHPCNNNNLSNLGPQHFLHFCNFVLSVLSCHISLYIWFSFFWHIFCVHGNTSDYTMYCFFSKYSILCIKRIQKNACILNTSWHCCQCLIGVELKSALCVCSLMSELWVRFSLCFDSLNHNSGRSISPAVPAPPNCHIRPNRPGFLLKGRNIITIPLFSCCKHPFPTHSLPSSSFQFSIINLPAPHPRVYLSEPVGPFSVMKHQSLP